MASRQIASLLLHSANLLRVASPAAPRPRAPLYRCIRLPHHRKDALHFFLDVDCAFHFVMVQLDLMKCESDSVRFDLEMQI
jgi:hypothetical protein